MVGFRRVGTALAVGQPLLSIGVIPYDIATPPRRWTEMISLYRATRQDVAQEMEGK